MGYPAKPTTKHDPVQIFSAPLSRYERAPHEVDQMTLPVTQRFGFYLNVGNSALLLPELKDTICLPFRRSGSDKIEQPCAIFMCR